jgi:hypothetical protein
MWLFLPSGLLMPAFVPEDKADKALTRDGEFKLQVRARVESHLTNFIHDYMEPGTYSDIEATPQMDYNFRFYTTHEHFALAMVKAISDIDYLKFKPTAEDRDADGYLMYKDGRAYHDALNSIWGTLCKLNTPGGVWGSYSSTNPNGYKSVRRYNRDDEYFMDEPPLNSQKWDDFDENGFPIETQDIIDGVWEEGGDYLPATEQRKQDIYDGLGDLPVDQWVDFLNEEDWKLIQEDVATFERQEAERAANVDSRWTRNSEKVLTKVGLFMAPRKKIRKGTKRYMQVSK